MNAKEYPIFLALIGVSAAIGIFLAFLKVRGFERVEGNRSRPGAVSCCAKTPPRCALCPTHRRTVVEFHLLFSST